MLEQPILSVSREEAPERVWLRKFFEEQGVAPKSGVSATTDELINIFLRKPLKTDEELTAYIQTNFENVAAILPKIPDHWYRRRTYNRIADDQDTTKMRFLSGEPSLERLESMLDEAIAQLREKNLSEHPLQVHLHILSVLENETDDKKIRNVQAIRNFFLATYKSNPKYKDIDIQITQNTASMRDHQMRETNGNLLRFETMDDFLKMHRGEEEAGVHQVYNIHCKAGQGRSATVMACEDIRYNGLLPSESSGKDGVIKRSRPNAHGISDYDTRSDQKCFMYAYFFHAAAEALADATSVSSGLMKRFNENMNNKGDEVREAEIQKLVAEAQGMLCIDYEHRLDARGNANPTQWFTKLTKSFLEFRKQFNDRYHVDLLERLIIDYANDPNSHSEVQKKNLRIILSSAEYPSTPDALIRHNQSSPNTPPPEVQQAIARAMIKDAYKPLSWWERVKSFFGVATRNEISISRSNLQKLCELGDVYKNPSLLPHGIAQHMPTREPRLSDEDRSVRLQTLSTSFSNTGSSDLVVSRAFREEEVLHSPPVPPPSRRDGLTL